MKRWFWILFWLTLASSAFAQPRATARELAGLQDSIWRWATANRGIDPVADAISGSAVDETSGSVRLNLILSDSDIVTRFRQVVHDSPLIRPEGPTYETIAKLPIPEGTTPPGSITMESEYALYPPGTAEVQLVIRSQSDSPLYFGTEYIVCRREESRWIRLPVVNAWNAVLLSIVGQAQSTADKCHEYGAGSYRFSVWLAPLVFHTPAAHYRIYKRVYQEHPRRDYLLSADFEISPLARYLSGGQNPRHLTPRIFRPTN